MFHAIGYTQHTVSRGTAWGDGSRDVGNPEDCMSEQYWQHMQTPPPNTTQETQYDHASVFWIPALNAKAPDRFSLEHRATPPPRQPDPVPTDG
jgi:hypothetical protein